MKTRFIILFLLIGFIAIVTKAQVCDIKGDWTGKLSVYGNEIPLVFHFDGEKCTIDSPDRLGKITCPVLALNGTKDRQVNSEENLNALMDRLAGQKEIKAIEGLNHMFQHCNTGDPSEYKDIEETFAPEALEVITTWLKMFK